MDPELRDALDALRRHVDASAAETRSQIDAIKVDFRGYVDASAAETRSQIDATKVDLRGYVDASAAETRSQIDATKVDLRGYVDASAAETRRHFEIVAEDLRGDIRQVAEGVVALSERVDRVEANLREEILRSQRELSAMIRFSYAELDRKIQTLEARVEGMDGRLQQLEASR